MRWFVFSMLILSLSSYAYAASLFETSDAITPPELPSSGIIAGENQTEILLILFDWNGNPVENMHLAITLDSSKGDVKTLKYLGSNEVLILVEPGPRKIILTGDSLNTPGGDYYYSGEFQAVQDKNISIRFLPAGSVRGTVSTSNGLADKAFVKFECGKRYGITEEITTDDYGGFTNDYLPVGTCRIYARDNGKIGFEDDVEIRPGEVTTVDIQLNQKSSRNIAIWPFIILFVAVIVIIFIFWRSKQPKKEKTKNSRTNDLLKTFNSKEQAIVGLLMKEGELYQNKISHNTGIPKTSLVRILAALQNKKVVELTKIGNTKKVKLTKWFLNKEK